MAGTVVGAIQYDATVDLPSLKKSLDKADAMVKGSADKQGEAASGVSSKTAVAMGAIAGVAAAAASKAISMVTGSIGDAVKRVDTLKNASRTFENMGMTATDSGKAMKALEKSIAGLPTPLDGAVRGMTALTATYGDIDKGQKVFSSLNNAILGFGGSAAMVDNAIMQLSQLPMDGPLDAQTWNSLRNSGLTPVLTAMAKDSGMSVAEMKKAFGDGTLTVEDFTDKLVKMNTDGGGGLKSLETIAKDSTNGIGTGFSNMQTAITRGMAKVIEAIGSENISSSISTIGAAFEKTLKIVADGIKFIVANKDVFGPIAVGIGSVVLAMKAWKIATTLWTAATTAAKVAMLALNIAMKANPIGLIITAIAALVSGLVYFFTQTEIGRNAWKTFTDFMVSAGKTAIDFIKQGFEKFTGFFTGLWDGIKGVFNGFVNFVKDNWFLILITVFTGGLALLVGLIIRNWDNIKEFTINLINNVVSFFIALPGKIGGFFTQAKNTVVDIWNGIPGWFMGKIREIGDNFNKVKQYIKEAFDKAKNAIMDINWGDVGMNIIKGIGNGFANMGGWLADKAKAVVNGAKDQLKKFLGIHSPSRVFELEIGKMMGLGMAEGIANTASLIANATKGLGEVSVDTIRKPSFSMAGVEQSASVVSPSTGSTGVTINQTNNVNTAVDMDVINRDLRWRLARI